jgi:hypothetical protein
MRLWLAAFAVVLTSCVGHLDDVPTADPGDDDPGQSPPPDDFGGSQPATDDGYIPKPLTATRFGIFYQVSPDSMNDFQRGLPVADNHAWLITQSHGTIFATRALADLVHQRADFYYAPAFDVWDASHAGWETASNATLATWAHTFRDAAIAAHADLFTFNEVPSTTAADAGVRSNIAALLRYLHDPDAQGRRLFGVVYFTEKPGTASSWSAPAPDFFAAIDSTSVAVVVEHYHSNGFVCGTSEAALADHYYGFRQWLVDSGEPAKISIANHKFAVLHSARYGAGTDGWAGGDSTAITLADYQRTLSRATKVSRDTAGGIDRLAFGPVSTSITALGVIPRIVELFNWHYGDASADPGELTCVAGAEINCTCN